MENRKNMGKTRNNNNDPAQTFMILSETHRNNLFISNASK